MHLVVGIMGWFASGKSVACRFLVDKGYYEIDVDEVGKKSHQILKSEIVAAFGEEVLEDNIISPKKLGNIVFSSEKELQKLNSIVHPWIKEEVKKEILENPHEHILINAAILPQLKLQELCDFVLMIDADEELLIQRGELRNNFPAAKVKGILSMQKSGNEYFETADYVIKNNGQLKEFYKKLEDFFQKLKEESHDVKRRKQCCSKRGGCKDS